MELDVIFEKYVHVTQLGTNFKNVSHNISDRAVLGLMWIPFFLPSTYGLVLSYVLHYLINSYSVYKS